MRSISLVHGLPALALVLVGACATTRGVRPSDMSAAEHEAVAAQEEQAGAAHVRSYDPNAVVTTEWCPGPANRGDEGGDACWTSERNPTAAQLDEAKEHRRAAAAHRAASQALRDAEARACVGLSEHDRDGTPFDHLEDIASVEPLRAGSSARGSRIEGAVITFRTIPGMSAQWFQRVLDCHLARNAALGHEVPEMPNCPLVPKDVTASVAATAKGFAVTVRSENADSAQEILRRAQRLVKP